MQEQRLIEMETKLAFQETTIQELNNIVTKQQNQLDILQAAIQELYDRIKSMSEEAVRDAADEPPPPHY
ncbi:MAG: SlyX family protein [Thioalkalispiraceae bacterium]|jgi:SlyX protein